LPTTYPKASPTEMMGLLVLLKDHKGAQDVARLADDLDLEIDEILPSLEFAEVLQLVSVHEGRAELTDVGRRLLAGSIRERKTILRDQLKRTTLFRTLLGALESAPERRLTDEEAFRLIEFTSAPADSLVQNIINWGRYTELFRYDADERMLLLPHSRTSSKSSSGQRPPSGPSARADEPVTPSGGRGSSPPVERAAPLASLAA
jgi:NitT/TauT family transport system ATP-binding protein